MLRSAPFNRCPRKLSKGEVKRVPKGGQLVGYHVGCPGCGFVAPYLAEEAGWVEQVDADGIAIVGVDRRPTCIRCRRRIGMVDGALAVE